VSDNMPFNFKLFSDFANDWNIDLVWSSPGILSITGWYTCYTDSQAATQEIQGKDSIV